MNPEAQDWTTGKLGELLPIKYGKGDPTGKVPVFDSSGHVGVHSLPLTNGPALIIGRKGTVGALHLSTEACWPIDTVYFTEADQGQNLQYFTYLLESLNLAKLDKSTAVPGLSRDDYNALTVTIALPEGEGTVRSGQQRKNDGTGSEGRWRCYDYDDLIARDKASLDIFWLKDDSLADSDNLRLSRARHQRDNKHRRTEP